MRKTDTTIINEKQYTIVQMPATQAVEVQLTLLSLLGGDAIKLMSNQEYLSKALSNIDPDKVLALIKKLVHKTELVKKSDSSLVDIDADFSGNLMDLYTLVFRVLQANYHDFFLEIKLKGKGLIENLSKTH